VVPQGMKVNGGARILRRESSRTVMWKWEEVEAVLQSVNRSRRCQTGTMC